MTKPDVSPKIDADRPEDHPDSQLVAGSQPPQTANHRQRVGAERRERMRGRLLNSALRLVASKGHATMSVDDVIREAEVSRGTFYKYFSSPDAIVRELTTEIANQIVRTVDPLVRGSNDPARLVARGIRLASRLALHYPAVAGFLAHVGWPGDQGPNMLEFVRTDIEDGFRQGRFTRMPMAIALNIVVGAVLGTIQRMQESDSREDYSEQAAAMALRALGIEAHSADEIARTLPDADEAQLVGALAATLGIARG
ncbi:TetR/AcrR family transcriptional regulator [Cupriavidus sp. H39]|uniref:TetR/AcrR family transcriptional regulator n=1 Tax=Cupriavidus sp. H39 TaxID=3401635 RepID=UPI003D029B5B